MKKTISSILMPILLVLVFVSKSSSLLAQSSLHYEFRPAIGQYTSCGNTTDYDMGYTLDYATGDFDFSSNYPYTNYYRGHIHSKVLSCTPNQITLRVEKCGGDYFVNGNRFRIFVLHSFDHIITSQSYYIDNSYTSYVDISFSPSDMMPWYWSHYIHVYLVTSDGVYHHEGGEFWMNSYNQYSINVSASPSYAGYVSGGGTYDEDDVVSVSASNYSGYTFNYWTEDGYIVSYDANYSFTASSNRDLVANFSQQQYSISASASPSSGGSVNGGGTYNHGSTVTLTASPSTGYSFDYWSEGGSPISYSQSLSFTATSNRSFVAHFSRQQHTVSVSASPSYGGSVSGGGSFSHGSSCTVTAYPANGYTFSYWSEGGSHVSSNASLTFTVNGNRSLVANFSQQQHTVSVSASPSNGGSVSGSGSFNHGASCTLTATPANGYTFSNWTEGGSNVSSNPTLTFTVNGNRNLVANFSQQQHTVSVSASPSNGGSVSGGGTFNHGSSCSLTATPADGFTFNNWTEGGNHVSSNTTLNFTVTGNRNLVANFSLQQHTISVSANPTSGGTVSGGGTVNHGTSVSVVAIPASGYSFTAWKESGVNVSTVPTYSFIANASRTLVAYFTRQQFTVNLSANPTNGGTVTGGGNYNSGTSAVVTATPNNGYVFDGWFEGTDRVTTNQSYSFVVNGNRTLVAHFIQQVVISASSSPLVGGSVSGAGTFNYGDNVTLVATPAPDYEFLNWRANNVVVNSNPVYSFSATENKNLVAYFNYNPSRYSLILDAEPVSGGYVIGSGAYTIYDTIQIVAVPNTCYTFSHWTKDGQVFSYSPTEQISIAGDEHYVAHFDHSNISHVGNVFGQSLVCEGSSATYSVAPVPDAMMYYWTKTDGTVVITQTPEISFYVDSTTPSGTLYVCAHNDCGNSDTARKDIMVNPSYDSVVRDTAMGPYSWEGNVYTESGEYRVTYPSVGGCDSTITLILHVRTSSIDGVAETMGIRVYPNPTATGKVVVEFAEVSSILGMRVDVVDYLGRMVCTCPVTSSKVEIDLAHVTGGEYFLLLKRQDKVLSTKAIIKR